MAPLSLALLKDERSRFLKSLCIAHVSRVLVFLNFVVDTLIIFLIYIYYIYISLSHVLLFNAARFRV